MGNEISIINEIQHLLLNKHPKFGNKLNSSKIIHRDQMSKYMKDCYNSAAKNEEIYQLDEINETEQIYTYFEDQLNDIIILFVQLDTLPAESEKIINQKKQLVMVDFFTSKTIFKDWQKYVMDSISGLTDYHDDDWLV